MTNDCGVIEDLLPLYVDGYCSIASSKLIESHISFCQNCNKQLELMRKPIEISTAETTNNLLKKKSMNKYLRTVKLSVGNIFLFAISVILFWMSRTSYIYVWLNGYDDIVDIANVFSIVMLVVIIVTGIGVVVSLTKRSPVDLKRTPNKVIATILFSFLVIMHIWFIQMSSTWGATNCYFNKYYFKKF